jgi:hypothetical protein
MAMPMLAPMVVWAAPSLRINGAEMLLIIFLATLVMASLSETSVITTVILSPPIRATVSVARTQSVSRWATLISSSSPAS